MSESERLGRRRWIAALAAAACAPEREEERRTPAAEEVAPEAPVEVAPPAAAPVAPPPSPWGLAAIPRLSLGSLPTPVEEAPALARALGLTALWIKRDDQSSEVFGGSKVRKLERFFAEAKAAGRRRVVTFGGVGSNHAVATAAFGAPLGFEVIVRLAPQPPGEDVARHLAACVAFGARVESVAGVADAFRRAERDASRGPEDDRAYVIPPGGTSDLGNLSMVDAAFELRAQIDRGELPAPDVIVLAMGTMGSAAGLALGLGAAGIEARILAVRCSSSETSNRPGFDRLVASLRRLCEAHGAPADLRAAPVDIDGGALGRGYGRPTREADRALLVAREHAGLELETTYTAKALAALEAKASSLAGRRVLFWASQPRPLSVDPRTVDAARVPAALRRFLEA